MNKINRKIIQLQANCIRNTVKLMKPRGVKRNLPRALKNNHRNVYFYIDKLHALYQMHPTNAKQRICSWSDNKLARVFMCFKAEDMTLLYIPLRYSAGWLSSRTLMFSIAKNNGKPQSNSFIDEFNQAVQIAHKKHHPNA